MARPLLQKTVVELEAMFNSAQGNASTLLALNNELKHRSTSKATKLQKLVQAAMGGAGGASTPVNKTGVKSTAKPPVSYPAPGTPPKTSATQPASRHSTSTVPTKVAPQATAPVPSPKPASTLAPRATNSAPPKGPKVTSEKPLAPVGVGTTPLPNSAASPEGLSVDDAYRILRCAPGSSWEAIEMSRRDIIEQAHPSKLANLSEPERQAQMAQAKRANRAYATLFALRVK